MNLSPCNHCMLRRTCGTRKGIVAAMPTDRKGRNAHVTAATIKCKPFDDLYCPGRRVRCEFVVDNGGADHWPGGEPAGIDTESFAGTIMRYDRRKRKVRLWLDDPLPFLYGQKPRSLLRENDKEGIIRPSVWPDRLEFPDENLDPVCGECGKPKRVAADDWWCETCGKSERKEIDV